jgi:hypothetical protein
VVGLAALIQEPSALLRAPGLARPTPRRFASLRAVAFAPIWVVSKLRGEVARPLDSSPGQAKLPLAGDRAAAEAPQARASDDRSPESEPGAQRRAERAGEDDAKPLIGVHGARPGRGSIVA